MSVRAIQARVVCDRPTLNHLWRTHQVFNERLPAILSVLMRMRRGECGATGHERNLYQLIARFVLARNAKDAPYLLNSISIKGWKAATATKQKVTLRAANGDEVEVAGATWAEEAAKLSAEGKLLYDKQKVLGDLPDTLRQMVARESVAIISGHDELARLWEEQHAQWLEQKAGWEAKPEHAKYLAIRSKFDLFETTAGGPATQRRERWHKYLDWLRSDSALAAWRGAEARIHPLAPEAAERIRKAKPWKRNTVEAEEFWKANPELKELDRLHGYYEREFVRRRKRKRNPDGFDHRPTFTLPHPVRHPRWFVFNAPQTSPHGYRTLVLPGGEGGIGSIELRLLTGQKTGDKFPCDWVSLRFKGDPRLADFRPCTVKKAVTKGSVKGQITEKPAYEFNDRQIHAVRPARISGVKLLFKRIRLHDDGSLRSAVPYLVFTCNIEDVPLTDAAKNVKWTETGAVAKSGKRRKAATVPDGLVACAIDLGIRHLGFATVAQYQGGKPRILRSRNIWIGHEEEGGSHPGRWSVGPGLAHLARHKRRIRKLRQLRGRPVHGEPSHIGLQNHITHMGEDRFKQGARAIINFALNVAGSKSGKIGPPFPRADVLILENLATLLPSAERERGINRSLIEFNRGHLVDRIKEVAEDVGLRVQTISPVGTSQVCSRCGALGRRYSIRRDEPHLPDIHFGPVEKLFACRCGYRANADHNASVNLHRRFSMGDAAVSAFAEFQGKNERERHKTVEALEGDLIAGLRRLHQLIQAAVAAEGPF